MEVKYSASFEQRNPSEEMYIWPLFFWLDPGNKRDISACFLLLVAIDILQSRVG
jgi:hypothetical protein